MLTVNRLDAATLNRFYIRCLDREAIILRRIPAGAHRRAAMYRCNSIILRLQTKLGV